MTTPLIACGWNDGPIADCFCEDCEELRAELRKQDVAHASAPGSDIRPAVTL